VKKVYRKFGEVVPCEINDDKFSQLDVIFKGGLSANKSAGRLRAVLQCYFQLYTYAHPGSRGSQSIADFRKSVEQWIRATKTLRSQVWQGKQSWKSPESLPDSQWMLLKSFFGPPCPPGRYPKVLEEMDGPLLPFFARILEGSIAAAEYTKLHLEENVIENESEVWFLWVALMARELESSMIKVSAPSPDWSGENYSPFVQFILKLHEWLPPNPKNRRLQRPRVRETPGSVAKGIHEARERYKNLSKKQMVQRFANLVFDVASMSRIWPLLDAISHPQRIKKGLYSRQPNAPHSVTAGSSPPNESSSMNLDASIPLIHRSFAVPKLSPPEAGRDSTNVPRAIKPVL
jgi:hypothetical protein